MDKQDRIMELAKKVGYAVEHWTCQHKNKSHYHNSLGSSSVEMTRKVDGFDKELVVWSVFQKENYIIVGFSNKWFWKRYFDSLEDAEQRIDQVLHDEIGCVLKGQGINMFPFTKTVEVTFLEHPQLWACMKAIREDNDLPYAEMGGVADDNVLILSGWARQLTLAHFEELLKPLTEKEIHTLATGEVTQQDKLIEKHGLQRVQEFLEMYFNEKLTQ